MRLAVPKETFPGERRVALVPGAVPALTQAGHEVAIEPGAGVAAGFDDAAYTERGAAVAADRDAVFAESDAILQVRTPGANPEAGAADIGRLRAEHVLIGHAEPLTAHETNGAVAETGATVLAIELLPRITRAQPMDALSSQANIAGYKAVVAAANRLPKLFPLMMTAAGTIRAARVFVVGAGVAGLQAIATARRLGALVHATDVRPEVQEQVESLGASFVHPGQTAEGAGGYAGAQTEEQQRRQRELTADTVAESDVVITTANIPGKRAPVLVTEEMVERMPPGGVIVDLAAERGGNCALTEPDEVVERHGVAIDGTTNLPAGVATDASQMYAGNVGKLVAHLTRDGRIELADDDPIAAGVLLCRDGRITAPAVREAMGLAADAGAGDDGGERSES